MDLSQFAQLKPYLTALGVEPWMYSVAFGFGIVHQFACGMLRFWTREWSFISALVGATAGSLVPILMHNLAIDAGALRFVTLLAVLLVAEFGANEVAKRYPWFPKFNEWVKNAPTDTHP